MSVIGGLGLASIHRLKATFSLLSPERKLIVNNLRDIMSTDGSYKNYRAALKAAASPLIPYM